jgi:hypothetical protein
VAYAYRGSEDFLLWTTGAWVSKEASLSERTGRHHLAVISMQSYRKGFEV